MPCSKCGQKAKPTIYQVVLPNGSAIFETTNAHTAKVIAKRNEGAKIEKK